MPTSTPIIDLSITHGTSIREDPHQDWTPPPTDWIDELDFTLTEQFSLQRKAHWKQSLNRARRHASGVQPIRAKTASHP